MPSGMTKVEIFNLALDLVKEPPVVSTDDPKATARFLTRNFDHTARTALRSYPWNCAKELVEISADAAKPAFKWAYAYTIPAGTLRILPITYNGFRFGTPVPHEIVGDKILTDKGAPLHVVRIKDIVDNPGLWDDLLVEYVRCSLALGMANKFSSKSKYVELASQLLNAAKEQAETIDAYEGTPEPAQVYDIIAVRGGDDYTFGRRF